MPSTTRSAPGRDGGCHSVTQKADEEGHRAPTVLLSSSLSAKLQWSKLWEPLLWVAQGISGALEDAASYFCCPGQSPPMPTWFFTGVT